MRLTVERDGNAPSLPERASAHAGSAARPTSGAPGAARRPPPEPPPTPGADTTPFDVTDRPGQPTRRAIAPQPRMHRLARHASLGGHLAHARAVQHRNDRPVPLLDDRQRQCQSRPPVADHANGHSRSRPLSSINRGTGVKHHPGQDKQCSAAAVRTFSTNSRARPSAAPAPRCGRLQAAVLARRQLPRATSGLEELVSQDLRRRAVGDAPQLGDDLTRASKPAAVRRSSARAHRRHRGLGPLRDLLRRHVLDVRRDVPHVAERVGDRAEAIAPELIRDLHRDRRSRVDRLLD
jgi:hypothetical protein